MGETYTSISDLPNRPAVYALYGGSGSNLYVAYVGVADTLKRRIVQHLVLRNSSITTGTAAVSLNPELVTEVRWWEHPNFNQRDTLEAAELVAFELLDPALRSRGGITARARLLYADPSFHANMQAHFSGEPSGLLVMPTLQTALARIAALEKRIAELEYLVSKVS
jgi:hypothetical protein